METKGSHVEIFQDRNTTMPLEDNQDWCTHHLPLPYISWSSYKFDNETILVEAYVTNDLNEKSIPIIYILKDGTLPLTI